MTVDEFLVWAGARLERRLELVHGQPRRNTTGAKLAVYFQLASVRHYLNVDAVARLIIHHARQEDAAILTRIVTEGSLDLAPAGLALAHADVFPSP